MHACLHAHVQAHARTCVCLSVSVSLSVCVGIRPHALATSVLCMLRFIGACVCSLVMHAQRLASSSLSTETSSLRQEPNSQKGSCAQHWSTVVVFQGGGEATATDILQQIEAAIVQQAQATASQVASKEARSATGDATLQSVVSHIEGRSADSEAKVAQALVAIEAGLTAVKNRVALANAVPGCPVGWATRPQTPGGRTIPDPAWVPIALQAGKVPARADPRRRTVGRRLVRKDRRLAHRQWRTIGAGGMCRRCST